MLLTKYLRCSIVLCGLCVNESAAMVLAACASDDTWPSFSHQQPSPITGLRIQLQHVTTTNERFEQLITRQQTKIISDIICLRIALTETILRDLPQHFDRLINAARDTLNKDDFDVSNSIFSTLSFACQYKRSWAIDPLLELTADKEYVYSSLVENAMLCYKQGHPKYLNRLIEASPLFKFQHNLDRALFFKSILNFAEKHKISSLPVLPYQYFAVPISWLKNVR